MNSFFTHRRTTAARAFLMPLLLPLAAQAAVTTTGTFYGSSGSNTWVGYAGNGTMLVNGGSGYTALALTLGYFATDTGTITVTGSGSTLTTNASVALGVSGTGVLNILDGAVVTSNGSSSSPSFHSIIVGYNSGSSGSVLVDGTGSQWYVPDMNMSVGGGNRSGSLTIRNGANVTFGAGSLGVDDTLSVTGTGSSLNMLASDQFYLGGTAGATATISAGGVINSAGDNTIGHFLGNTGSMTVTGEGSEWNAVGNLYVGSYSGTGTLTVADGAVVSVSTTGTPNAIGTGFESIAGDGVIWLGHLAQSTNSGTPPSTGTLNIGTGGAAGRLNVSEVYGYYSAPTHPYPWAVATLVFNHNETAYEFTNTAGNGIVISGTTDVIQQAGTTILTATNTYFGTTSVNAGTLIVNGSLANTVVTVASGATLGGSGRIDGFTTIQSGGHLAAGNSPGTLTFTGGLALADGAILDFELGTTSDLIRISGGILSADGTITVNLFDSGGFTAGTYTLLDATGATLSSIGATSFDLGQTIAGYTYEFAQNGDLIQLIAMTAIPEPATVAAFFGALSLALAALRRRRTK